jgi:KipI family sensor histidine kinase inhibitor
MTAVPRLSVLGTSALLFEAPGETTLETQRRIWALAAEAESWAEVNEAAAGLNNLLLSLRHPPRAVEALERRLVQAWQDVTPLPLAGRVVDLPVTYGGTYGPHIADVVAHTGLTIDAIVELHSAPLYPVYALGSHPGYCYLGGMESRIATPRRKVPVLNIPGGAVSIGGAQTGVSASAGPSGWNTIGHTDMQFFDVSAAPPVLLQPGDSIRFRIAKVIR